MPENADVPEAAERIRTGDVPGTMIVGHGNTVNNLDITAEYGASVTVHTGPPPAPVKRRSISQLPRSAGDPLIGREPDVLAVREAVGTRQLVQVWGASGVGKSALLRHLAHALPSGPEGAAFIEAGGRTADDIAQAIFDIGFEAPNYKPSPEVLKEHLKTLRLRIYLDDAELDGPSLRRLFDFAEQSEFVLTSQRPSALGGVHAIPLKGLAAPAAAELVAALVGRELRPEEASTLPALCDAVHGNPLQLRRIASSAATGESLPGISELPALLPALVNRLRPEERDLLHLLGSLSGAELAARQLSGLLGRTDAGALADGLVRPGLLVASETGYSCPPDVSAYVLESRATEFPADRLCRALAAWARARETSADDVAARFQALDIAVLRAERGGHAELGMALARAASPKLALSRQFDAWGSLLGAGWAAAKSTGDKAGEQFFLHEARTRRKAIGRAALTSALVLEADVLWRELTALRAHSAAHQVANAALSTARPVQTGIPTHLPGHLPPATHTPVTTSPTPAPTPSPTPAPVHAAVHPPVAKPVVDLSGSGLHSHAAAQVPQQIDFSRVVTATGPPAAHGPSTGAPATGAGHTPLTAVGAAGAKSGISALAIACAVGCAAVLGVGATVYANSQSNPPAGVSPSPVGTAGPTGATAPAVDPVCATVVPDLQSEIQQIDTDSSAVDDAVDSYNTSVDTYNSGETSTQPGDDTVVSALRTEVSDLQSFESTLQEGISQSQDSSVSSDLNDMLTPAQQVESQDQSIVDDAGDIGGDQFDTSTQAAAIDDAGTSLQSDCGD